MAKSAYVNFRTDQEVKEKAEKIYAAFGLGLGDALNMFLRRSVMVGGCPFDLRLPEYSDEEDIQTEEKTVMDSPKDSSQKIEIETREILSSEIVEDEDEENDEWFSDDDDEDYDEEDDDDEGFVELDPNDPDAKSVFDALRERGMLAEPSSGDASAQKKQRVLRRGNEVRVEEILSRPILGHSEPPSVVQSPPAKKPGRNDPCWCGSKKKYKKCHGR